MINVECIFLPITSGDLCNDHLTSSSLVAAAKGNYSCTTVVENYSKMSNFVDIFRIEKNRTKSRKWRKCCINAI